MTDREAFMEWVRTGKRVGPLAEVLPAGAFLVPETVVLRRKRVSWLPWFKWNTIETWEAFIQGLERQLVDRIRARTRVGI